MSTSPYSFHKKRPKQARARQLTESIIEAAGRVFKSTDFLNATTNRIAEIAGVSIGSLYQYFPNKDSLVGVLIERRVHQQLASLEQLLTTEAAEPCEKVIHDLIAMIARDSLANRTFMKTLYQRGVSLQMIPVVAQAREKSCRLLEDFLKKNHASQVSHHPNLGFTVFCLMNSVLGAVFASVLASEREVDASLLVDELSAMAVGHLLKHQK